MIGRALHIEVDRTRTDVLEPADPFIHQIDLQHIGRPGIGKRDVHRVGLEEAFLVGSRELLPPPLELGLQRGPDLVRENIVPRFIKGFERGRDSSSDDDE